MPHKYILLSENAYFYRKSKNKPLAKNFLHDLFNAASLEKRGKYLLHTIKEIISIANVDITYSICVFKLVSTPTFIDRPIPGWEEQRLAYVLLADYGDYVLFMKKNAPSLEKFLKSFIPVDYSVLTRLYVQDNTSFERFALNNLSITPDIIKGKIIEADDLKKSFTGFGANTYTLNSMRVNNNEKRVSIAFNTSRISSLGERKYLEGLFTWGLDVVTQFRNDIEAVTFLSIFAEPADYEKLRDTLKPIYLLLNLSSLYSKINDGEIIGFYFRHVDGTNRSIPMEKLLAALKEVFSVQEVTGTSGKRIIKLDSSIIKDAYLSLNEKSITVSSPRASNIAVRYANGTEESLLYFFNRPNDFIIGFDNISYVYSKRKLFKDSKLLGNIDNFLDIFISMPELATASSEKGNFSDKSTVFTPNIIFHFVDEFYNDSEYLFLDDLGDEWADFISLKGETISLIHAKHGSSVLSASDFHDVVGQALKNIGNIVPTSTRLGAKSLKFAENYRIQNIQTAIPRLRRGGNVPHGIDAYTSLLQKPNLRKEITIVINFISRAHLETKFEQLKNNEQFAERKQAIQMLWMVSSLISSCKESGITIKILCKP